MKTLGIRHIALNVPDLARAKDFYVRVLKMTVEWEPDPDNIYLTSGGHDNLALHKGPPAEGQVQKLDHFGFALPTLADVDAWYVWMQTQGASILREIKTHRDGARSFYVADPDGNVIQMIYHPPIAERSLQPS